MYLQEFIVIFGGIKSEHEDDNRHGRTSQR